MLSGLKYLVVKCGRGGDWLRASLTRISAMAIPPTVAETKRGFDVGRFPRSCSLIPQLLTVTSSDPSTFHFAQAVCNALPPRQPSGHSF